LLAPFLVVPHSHGWLPSQNAEFFTGSKIVFRAGKSTFGNHKGRS
jgi:hypothetical protein